MLNGRELIERGIIFGAISEENISQHGIDLNLIKVDRIGADQLPGRVSKKADTLLATYENVPALGGVWALEPGVYNVEFAQGCEIPADMMMLIRQRSSLLRNGAFLHSSVFDAGFNTTNIGTVLFVHVPIVIEYEARIAQIYGHQCTEVENLYNGQWQFDKQREE